LKVLFTPSGRKQFLAAMAYIYHENPPSAVAFRRKLEKALSRLRQFPQSGRALPEFPDLPFREIIVSPYCFFYRGKGKLFGSLLSGTVFNFRKNQMRHKAPNNIQGQ
jgi:toxin ParE1/3/4